MAYAVGKTKEEFVRDLRLYTSDENEQKIEALLQRRIAGEPLAYLIGEWEFHGLPIVVTPDVLIPRMDTEVLVDAALRVLVGRKMHARILDLCSGSGCIGCALALWATGVLTLDQSPAGFGDAATVFVAWVFLARAAPGEGRGGHAARARRPGRAGREGGGDPQDRGAAGGAGPRAEPQVRRSLRRSRFRFE